MVDYYFFEFDNLSYSFNLFFVLLLDNYFPPTLPYYYNTWENENDV